jgi:hypothetical protein
MTDLPDILDHGGLGAALFNRTWELIGKEDRTPADDDRMLHMAHASRYHWGEVGSAANLVRGEWQCSREAARTEVERALAVEIADEEDRALLLADLETVPGLTRFW